MLFLLTTFEVSGQNQVPVAGYLHLTGTLNNEIQVTMDLVKLGDSLYADISCRGEDRNAETIPAGPITCFGKTGADLTFNLRDQGSNQVQVIKGTFEKDLHAKGTWKNQQGETLPFEFVERYPEGSVQFNVYHVKEVKKLVKKPVSPKASIDLVVLIPGESGNNILSDTLRKIIQQCYFGKTDPSPAPDSLIAGMKDIYFENYQTTNSSLYSEMRQGPSYNWEMLKYMHILNNQDYLLTFYIISYGFSGGAHGMETQDFYSVDLRSGRLLMLRDIIRAGSEDGLSQLLTQKLRKQANLKDGQKLSEAGYFVEEVKPNANFYLTADGLVFFYNHYDIAPHSFGATNLFLTFDELRGLLK